MLAHEFSNSEAPTNPIGPRPLALAPAENAPVRRTHVMLVGTPRLPARGLTWLQHRIGLEFDGVELQRMLTLERLSLG
ncbi:MAG TPA: hypothetical protein VHV51_02385 [Polyangiaceae bacterium]|nr:hypothetical protein [Polyangiaceae bacterium]